MLRRFFVHMHGPALCLALGLASGAAQAASVEFLPAAHEVQAGASFSVRLVGRDFTENLDGGGVSLAFDPTVLAFVDASFDAAWDFFTEAGVLDAAAGTLTDMQFNQFGSPRVGDFDIATLNFQALAPGMTTLSLSLGANPFASGGEVVAVTLGAGSVTVVPLPAPLALLSVTLGALALRRWQAYIGSRTVAG